MSSEMSHEEWIASTVKCPLCHARSPIDGLQDRIRQEAVRQSFDLPANFTELTTEELALIGHEMTYPKSKFPKGVHPVTGLAIQ